MKNCFDLNNPNSDIFIVPTQEGTDPEDQWNGSIGDAVAQHVYDLNQSERQLWENIICTPDGNLFRVNTNIEPYDKDPFHLKGKDLDNYLEQYKDKVSKESLQAIKEAIEEENIRREKSEDALDLGETIPYSEWEKFPQMWNSIDIPKTPKDKLMYCGNTRQQFYDVFPEGHPNALLINTVLNRLNAKEPELIDENYGNWVKNFIREHKSTGVLKNYVADSLNRLIDSIVADPAYAYQYVIGALKCIDSCWADEFKKVARKRFVNDPIYRLFLTSYKNWEERFNNGESVYSDVKTFGQIMFNDPALRSQMTGWHWQKYKNIRRKFAPKVVVRGFDINRCSRSNLEKALRCDSKKAREVWLGRPFDNIQEIYNLRYIDKETFGGTEKTDKIIDWLDNITQNCINNKSFTEINVASQKMIQAQSINKINLTDDEWNMLWVFHKICKNEVINKINEKG